jgi:prepilin-type N-terminal cleavage/methylation domain-containing protein
MKISQLKLTLFQQKKQNKNQKGFSLIELIVVIGVTSIIMITASTLFISFNITNYKSEIDQKVKIDGNNALSHIEFVLRNAREVTSTCTEAGYTSASISLDDLNNNNHEIQLETTGGETRLKDTINGTDDRYITSSVNTISDLNFTCYLGNDSDIQYVTVNFKMKRGGTVANANTAQASFKTGVTIRNLVFTNP